MISIIIPCYNAGKTMRKCAQSFLSQTFKDLELLLVDDASHDNTLSVAKSLQSEDGRVKVLHLEKNAGVDNARFEGLKNAKGEFVMFCDSDDWISRRDALQLMYDKINETGADYVEIGMDRVFDRFGILKSRDNNKEYKEISNPELFDDYYLSFFGVNILSVSMCAKLYRMSTIRQASISPSGLHMGEDLHFNLMLFPYLQKIAIMDFSTYNYRFGGITTRYNKYLFDELHYLYLVKKDLIEKYNYHKADDYIRIELKNVFRSEICQSIRFLKDTNTVKELIAKRLTVKALDDLREVKKPADFTDEPLVKAILDKDVDAVYNICYDIESKNIMNYRLKSLVAKTLSILRL